MNLENRIIQKLGEQTASSNRHGLEVADVESGWTLDLTADRRDDLSCLVWEMTLTRTEPASADLSIWAHAVAGRTLALTEPLKVQEIDASRGEALLRTLPVLRRGQRLYYEACLQGTASLTLRRFQAPEAGQRREQVAFPLTTETLARLVGELAGA